MSDDSLDRKVEHNAHCEDQTHCEGYLKAGLFGVIGLLIGSAGYNIHTAIELAGKSELIDCILKINGCIYYTTGAACVIGGAYVGYRSWMNSRKKE